MKKYGCRWTVELHSFLSFDSLLPSAAGEDLELSARYVAEVQWIDVFGTKQCFHLNPCSSSMFHNGAASEIAAESSVVVKQVSRDDT